MRLILFGSDHTKFRILVYAAIASLLWTAGASAQVAEFETRAMVNTGVFNLTSGVVGDFNRDGKPDLAVLGDNGQLQPELLVLLENGDGTSHGPAFADFSQTNNCPKIIGAGASCTMAVTFAPTVTGTRRMSVYFQDDDSGSPQSVALSGTGD